MHKFINQTLQKIFLNPFDLSIFFDIQRVNKNLKSIYSRMKIIKTNKCQAHVFQY